MDGTMGEIRAWAGATNRIPQGWSLCQGQVMTIQSYAALFSIIGTIYGGDGKINFLLPNMQGRFIVGVGTVNDGTDSRNFPLGEKKGSLNSYTSISASLLPQHIHAVNLPALTVTGTASGTISAKCCSDVGDQNSPKGNACAGSNNAYVNSGDATDSMAAVTASLSVSGSTTATSINSQPGGGSASQSKLIIPTVPPYFAISWIICIEGYYPSFD